MWTEAVDLHSHSHHSDGMWSPTEMATRAHDNGVKVWALTDHDTIEGWAEASSACNRLGIRFVAGVEITCGVEMESTTHNPTSWHLLAYFPNGADEKFSTWLSSLKDARIPRMKRMLEALSEFGHDIEFDEVSSLAAGSVGRPHLARVMVSHGIVESESQAFEEWIGDDGPAFRSRPLPSISEAVEMVHASGGITSLAHAGYYGIPLDVLFPHLKVLRIDCIEAVHNSHPDGMRFAMMSQGMPVTVGGDSHGTENRPSPGRMPVSLNHLHPYFHP